MKFESREMCRFDVGVYKYIISGLGWTRGVGVGVGVGGAYRDMDISSAHIEKWTTFKSYVVARITTNRVPKSLTITRTWHFICIFLN